MIEKKAEIRLDDYSQLAQELLKRYAVGAKIGSVGVVERIEQLGIQIVIHFKAESNAILSVFGRFKDSVGCKCTLVPL